MATNPFDLSGKWILVTGASSGIGRATAIVLSRWGARVVLSGRREDALSQTQSQMLNPAAHITAPFDLMDVDAVPQWLKEVVGKTKDLLHGMVHSAGVGGLTPLKLLKRATVDAVMVPNFYAALALVRGTSSKLVSHDGASMVLVSSVAGLVGSAGMVSYSASKAALHGLARSAAQELKDRRIRVNCIAPGYVRTPMMEASKQSNTGDFEAVEKRQFLGFSAPEEVAAGIGFLLSDAARTVTGTVLVMDGGFSC